MIATTLIVLLAVAAVCATTAFHDTRAQLKAAHKELADRLPTTAVRAQSLTPDRVHLDVDPQVARQLASAWAAWHTSDITRDQLNPRWHDDVVTLHHAAMRAELRSGRIPRPANVKLIRVPSPRQPA